MPQVQGKRQTHTYKVNVEIKVVEMLVGLNQ